jgi:tetratricopeptide (TPR) repeat protein
MRLSRWFVVLFLILGVCATASADKKNEHKAEAKAHYDNAVRRFDLGKYEEAAQEFTTAFELSGEAAILYNIGQAYRLAGKFEEAAGAYRSVLRRLPDVGNRDEIKGRIDEMDERAAEQKRQASRREAERLAAERKAAQDAALRAQQNGTKPGPQGPEPPPRGSGVSDNQPHPGRTLKITGYALCGLTGVGIIMGAAMSALTVQASNKVQSAAKQGGQTFTSGLNDTQSKGMLYDKLQIVGYSIGGAAAVGAAVTLYLGFRADKRAQEAPSTPTSFRDRLLANTTLSPMMGANGGGLMLGGRF